MQNRVRHCIPIGIFLLLTTSVAYSHPVSYTDAWVKVSDTVAVRLNLFLDDVIRHQLTINDDQTVVAAEEFQAALKKHTETLQTQLKIFDQSGRELTSSVKAAPSWDADSGDVDLSSVSSLKLTWQLEYQIGAASQPSTALSFVHDFTHPDLTEPGELRLHLQHLPSRRRFDSVIPPRRPHTVLFPDPSQTSTLEAINSATSRLVITPVAAVHEFTAPLLMLEAVSQSEFDVASVINEKDARAVRRRISLWMQSNVQLLADGALLECSDIQVQLVPPGTAPDFGDGTEGTNELSVTTDEGLPVVGTLAAIRMLYRPVSSADELSLSFHQRPGAFEEWATELVTATNQTASNLSFETTDGRMATLIWSAAELTSPTPGEHPKPSADVLENWTPLTSTQSRPGVRGSTAALLCAAVVFAFAFFKRRTASRQLMATLTGVGVVIGGAFVWAFPDHSTSVNQQHTEQLTGHLLQHIYSSALLQNEHEAVARLSDVLEADLVEQIYLSTRSTLAATSAEALLVDLQAVEVDGLTAMPIDNRRNAIRAATKWRVTGTVYHWGHRHQRELIMGGDIVLTRIGDDWKISEVVPTQAAMFAPVRKPENGS